MDKVFAANTDTSAPTDIGSVGFPTDGDLSTGKLPTIPGAYWFWMITAELMAVVTGAGITLSGSTLHQVYDAIVSIANTAAAGAAAAAESVVLGWFTGTHQDLTAAKGYQDIPGGRTHQWVEQFQASVGSNDVVITYRKTFSGTAPIPQVTIYDASLAGGSSNFLGYGVTARSLTGCTISFGPNGGAGRDITVRVDAFGNT